MQDASEGGRIPGAGSHAASETDGGRVSYLEQALWTRFREASSAEDFIRAWLALQCSIIGGVRKGVVVSGPQDTGPFAPVAYWPDELDGDPALAPAAERALRERRGVLRGAGAGKPGARATCEIAYPFVFDGKLHGAVALEVANRSESDLRAVMRQLRWGTGWIELAQQRREQDEHRERLSRAATALDLIAAAVEEDTFHAAGTAAVTELATRLDCERVSIGFVRQNRTKVTAVSHTADFGKRMSLVRAIGHAMDEAVDQRETVIYPLPDPTEHLVVRAHQELQRSHGASAILTVPMRYKDSLLGAMSFEFPRGGEPDNAGILLCESVAAAIGPILEEKRRNDRWLIFKAAETLKEQALKMIGPRHVTRKLVSAALVVLVLFFAFVRGDYTVTAPSRLEGFVRRAVVAPFDGFVLSERRRAGDKVSEGEVLAVLDDRDIVLEQKRWIATRRQHLREFDKAMAEGDRAKLNIIRTQIAQAEAQIELYGGQSARSIVVAPFDGIVATGDLSQSIGGPVSRGEVLYEVAPLDHYRVILEVDEGDVRDVSVGQSGQLLLSSLPDEPLSYVIERLTPVAEAREGRNYYLVEARLTGPSVDRLRPGMKGISKTEIDTRRLIWIWTHSLFRWLRITLWPWMP